MIGIIGKKIGMSRIFTNDGISIPVTIIKIEANYITQIKNKNNDGYNAIQVTTGLKKSNHVIKPELGHFNKANVRVGIGLWEFRINENLKEKFHLGQVIDINFFNDIKKVDITSISKGKGFSGTIKRWNFSSQDATHGNSLSHRAPGSIGQNQTPRKVFKGKKMAGQLGNKRVTIQNLNLVNIDIEHNLLLVEGSVPGITGSYLIIKPSIKNRSNL